MPLLWGTLGGEVRGLLASGFRQPLLIYVLSAVGTMGQGKPGSSPLITPKKP